MIGPDSISWLSRSTKSQAREWLRTSVKARIILSNPFLPDTMEGRRRSSSIAGLSQSKYRHEKLTGTLPYLDLTCFLP